MKILTLIALAAVLAGVGLLGAGQFGLLNGKQPQSLGVTAGRLSPPSLTPNSVSSQAAFYPDHPQREYAQIAPLSYKGDGEVAMTRLADLLAKNVRTVVTTRRTDYIYAQCTTALLKFTDDVEFWLDKPNNVIQVRSASRLGLKDLGVNRARVESIRAQFSN
jgi:uncharacterized protein (DUF1499 family)